MNNITQDGFLGGKLLINQPAKGHRSGIDAVLLAASISATPNMQIAELGCGVGVASLCLAARLPDISITGYDIDAPSIALAQQNAQQNIKQNKLSDIQFVEQDIHAPFSKWAQKVPCDQVFANPPFYATTQKPSPPNEHKEKAHMAKPDTLAIWVKRGVSLLKANGCLTFIHVPEALPELLAAMTPRLGGVEILPIVPFAGTLAKRVLIRGWRDSRAPLKILSPLVLHREDKSYQPQIESVLRHGERLVW